MLCLLRQCSPAGLRNKVTGGIRGYRAMDMCHCRFYGPAEGLPVTKEKRTRESGAFANGRFEAGRQKFQLLLLVFVFPFTVFDSLLRFGFFHGFLGFGGSLGADLRPFLTLFLLQLLASQ